MLPEITIESKGKKHKVISMDHCYGEFTDKKEAIELKRSMDHYRNNAHLHMFCNGLDGEDLIGNTPPLTALTPTQIHKLQGCISNYKENILVHPSSGAMFFIKEMNMNHSVQSPLVASNIGIEIIATNCT
jgi:hypothetical protein